ncbi:MAG: class I SAM-dependent methyltransferase [Candidatus Tectomicrobia bacterium]|uniref:Class I SAM-dependent methyltransferase n=1 Tax=Tectimicrobiota bacterium TaxID=2528274 RepID=A0A933GKV1_UNCTE|nr:class I SAM-dependent methyltransferase [Candidatus Tectomicrobia bacterium]
MSLKQRVDTQWDDTHVFPSRLFPDTENVFEQMTKISLNMARSAKGARTLDLGCGLGQDLFSLLCKGQRVFGLDASMIMLKKASNWLSQKGTGVPLIEGIGEQLPFKNSTFQVVFCKGAIDHFYDPNGALQEMSRVIQPGGWIVLAVANFESLSCQLSRLIERIRNVMFPKNLLTVTVGRKFWELPLDHQHKFDFFVLRELVNRNFLKVKAVRGVSLLWGVPRWGHLLERLPKGVQQAILEVLNTLANLVVFWSDVVVVSLEKR